MNQENDDSRHRREEAERRERRKASKSQKSESQREKERKRKEHAQKILQQHGGKKQKTASSAKTTDIATVSAFQDIFKYRAQGFEISFKFRNAPPRPPVGPNFMGADLDEKLRELSKYKPLNAVEANYRWKLHTEPDLGVPLAPSAVDPLSYRYVEAPIPQLEAADLDLLEWKGSMGDTAAEALKKMQEDARASARLALLGKQSFGKRLLEKSKLSTSTKSDSSKKLFSRVLNEGMQSWMKKTTYITNDYSRKVHDFKSLAKTKREAEEELEVRQRHITQRRSASSVSRTFEEVKQKVAAHPHKSGVHPVAEMEFLPDERHWSFSYTHVVLDQAPDNDRIEKVKEAVVANVQREEIAARMTCDMFVPIEDMEEPRKDSKTFAAMQQYDLDVTPLKEEDAPHITFFLWVDSSAKIAKYVPVSSRVHLSSGKPLEGLKHKMYVNRRPMNDDETSEMKERLMQLEDMAGTTIAEDSESSVKATVANQDDDGESD